VLVAEDNRADLFLIREALAQLDAELHVAGDGEEAIRYLARIEADPAALCPDLVILDINLPKHKGNEVLEALRGNPRCRQTPVLVVTTSDSQCDREMMDQLGTDGYFRKPSEYVEFMKLGEVARLLLDKKGEPRAHRI
jgi:chemotaxis family two-component system response regulator Rcp1